MDILPLFPIALGIGQIDLGDWAPDWKWETKKEYTGHMQQIGLERLPEFQDLKKQLEEIAQGYTDVLGSKCPTLKITQMWANSYAKGASIHQHQHPNSLISGVLYWDDYSSTTFVNPVIPQIKLNYEEDSANPFQAEHCTVQGIRGRVFVFPSWLQHHGVISNQEHRITLSFNTFPRELGNYNRLDHWKA